MGLVSPRTQAGLPEGSRTPEMTDEWLQPYVIAGGCNHHLRLDPAAVGQANLRPVEALDRRNQLDLLRLDRLDEATIDDWA